MLTQYENSVQFSNIMTCSKRNNKIIKVVTAIFGEYVFIIPGLLPYNDICINGIPCNVPSQNNNLTTWRMGCCSGLYVELFQLVINDINIDYQVYIVADGKFGAFKDGRWNGMIHELYTKRADIAMQQVTVLAQRFNVVDFTQRVFTERIPLGIVIRNIDSEYVVVNWSFIDSMNKSLLIAVAIASIIIFLVVFALENVGYVFKYGRRYSFRESLSYVNGVLFQRDLGGVLPRRWPGKVVSIVYAFGMTIMIGTYTAQLTASNIAIEENGRFNGFKDKVVRFIFYIYLSK